ncbi:hypothetical protein ARTHRO9AX_210206 [Arthrobacter sp. 9AX]|nr:hypothetical protein ARTHRO9AX_210206 [Arthrobacter sp. 9AX]
MQKNGRVLIHCHCPLHQPRRHGADRPAEGPGLGGVDVHSEGNQPHPATDIHLVKVLRALFPAHFDAANTVAAHDALCGSDHGAGREPQVRGAVGRPGGYGTRAGAKPRQIGRGQPAAHHNAIGALEQGRVRGHSRPQQYRHHVTGNQRLQRPDVGREDLSRVPAAVMNRHGDPGRAAAARLSGQCLDKALEHIGKRVKVRAGPGEEDAHGLQDTVRPERVPGIGNRALTAHPRGAIVQPNGCRSAPRKRT